MHYNGGQLGLNPAEDIERQCRRNLRPCRTPLQRESGIFRHWLLSLFDLIWGYWVWAASCTGRIKAPSVAEGHERLRYGAAKGLGTIHYSCQWTSKWVEVKLGRAPTVSATGNVLPLIIQNQCYVLILLVQEYFILPHLQVYYLPHLSWLPSCYAYFQKLASLFP